MKSLIRSLITLIAMSVCAFSASAQTSALTPIRISYQPAFWGVTFEIATEKGWWKEAGLAPTFTLFPSGAPQIAAGAAGDWDVGALGAPPAVLGAVRYGLQTIGVAAEESAANAVIARKDQIAAIRANPQSLKGQQFLVSTNSTGEFAAWGCMRKLGVARADMQWVNLAPPQLVSAFANGTGGLAATWTPNVYTLNQQIGSEVLCTAKDAGLFLFSAVVVRQEFLKANPDVAARFLATYLRAVAWEKANPEETLKILSKFYERTGTVIDPKYVRQELTKDRSKFRLAEQLQFFNRSAASSPLDKAVEQIIGYMTETGTVRQSLEPKAFVTDEVLKRIDSDPKLKAWANGQ